MKCPKCQTESPEKKKFCHECGANLFLTCPRCGAEVLPSHKFCGECGYNLGIPLEPSPKAGSIKEAKIEFEKAFIVTKLHEFNWNISQTAEAIGMERSNLHKKIKAYRLDRLLGTPFVLRHPFLPTKPKAGSIKEARTNFEEAFILSKLREFNWNISQTAEAIGMERSNLHKKIKAYRLDRFRPQ